MFIWKINIFVLGRALLLVSYYGQQEKTLVCGYVILSQIDNDYLHEDIII